jgi:DNA-binding transcriptional MerR regulator
MIMAKVQPKVKKLYYSIGEVSELTQLKAYVLRYWETEFSKLKPPKNRAGNRTYRQKDIDMILNIKDLLYNKKFTISGARSVISGKESVLEETQKSPSINEKQLVIYRKIKEDLTAILNIITE